MCLILTVKCPWTALCLVHRKKQSLYRYLFPFKSHLPGGMLADLGGHLIADHLENVFSGGFCLKPASYQLQSKKFHQSLFLLRPCQARQSPPQSQISLLHLKKQGGEGKRETRGHGLACSLPSPALNV